ncbi:hypothetical protein [uncultured Clostridium sp.]|nr:hypothetical protein [uncultured Clostridium sp.]
MKVLKKLKKIIKNTNKKIENNMVKVSYKENIYSNYQYEYCQSYKLFKA